MHETYNVCDVSATGGARTQITRQRPYGPIERVYDSYSNRTASEANTTIQATSCVGHHLQVRCLSQPKTDEVRTKKTARMTSDTRYAPALKSCRSAASGKSGSSRADSTYTISAPLQTYTGRSLFFRQRKTNKR